MNTTNSYYVLGHLVTPIETIGDYGLVQIVSPPGVPGPPPHHHVDSSEFFYVADGALDVQINGEWQTLKSGESLSIPKGTVHTLRNTTERDCRWLTGWSPRGFETFFTNYGVPADAPDAARSSVSDEIIGRVMAECADFGMVIAAEAD